MANKRGRKRKPGERYPSGDLKPAIAPAFWARIRDIGGKSNPIFRTELYRLSVHHVLSDAQTLAGFYVGDIYRQYCTEKTLETTPHRRKSSDDMIDSRMNSRQPLLFSGKGMRAEQWHTVENEVEALLRPLRSAVLDLCVLNQPINSVIYPEMRNFLDHMAGICGADLAHSQVRKLTFPTRRPSTEVPAKHNTEVAAKHDDDAERAAFKETLKILKPDFKPKELSDATDMFLAFRDREDFRHAKLTGGTATPDLRKPYKRVKS
jgi:hypothetical protein